MIQAFVLCFIINCGWKMISAFLLCFMNIGGDDLGICIVFYNCRWR